MSKHKWSFMDNDYVIREAIHAMEEDRPITTDDMALHIGTSPKSVSMKISNYNHLLGVGGLPNASKICSTILESYDADMVVRALARIQR